MERSVPLRELNPGPHFSKRLWVRVPTLTTLNIELSFLAFQIQLFELYYAAALPSKMRFSWIIIDMTNSLGEAIGLPIRDTTMNVSIHEDNVGALVLARTLPPQFTPRSKFYAAKMIWFREEINKRGIKLLKIDTVEQLGDIFTKGLPRATFEYLRKKIMGW